MNDEIDDPVATAKALRANPSDADREMAEINKSRGKFFGANPSDQDRATMEKKVDPYDKTVRGRLSRAFDIVAGPKELK